MFFEKLSTSGFPLLFLVGLSLELKSIVSEPTSQLSGSSPPPGLPNYHPKKAAITKKLVAKDTKQQETCLKK